MGTRCLTEVLEQNGDVIITLYRQFDGYPRGHGKELKDFLEGFHICNGIGIEQDRNRDIWANGMSCLAAQIVSHFKRGIGEFYLYKPGTRGVWEEYIYTIKENDSNSLDVEVFETYNGGKVLYSGPIKDFNPQELEED
jgi:hypothetical protein